jgi:hypothetical protein
MAGYRISGCCLVDPIIYLFFLKIRQEKKFARELIKLLDHALFNAYLQKSKFFKAVFVNLFNILPKIKLSNQVTLPDIRYPALGLAEYPAKTVSGASLILSVLELSWIFKKSRISEHLVPVALLRSLILF